jgi:cobyrinic acid a,c-diamide synthase
MVNPICPRIVVAGTHSGVGKTSVALALAASLSRRGLRVRPFKIGPDYLDPSYLQRASGCTCYNLDGWMSGKAYVQALFDRTSRGSDLALIEGVMGLFDGADPVHLAGSTAEVAEWLDAPVLLVVDAHGSARSLAAVVHGFVSFDDRIRVAGVIANRVGSERHAQSLRQSFHTERLPPLLGTIPRGAFPELPRRHLGLVTADQDSLPESTLDALADALERWVDLSQLLALVGYDPSRQDRAPAEINGTGCRRVRVGIAWDQAFHFYYQDNLEALESAGCAVIRFSPLHDEALPPDLSGLYLGGGYPECHAQRLAENHAMLASIRAFAGSGRPIYAECGGLMYLSRGIVTLDAQRHAMLGIVPCWTRMLDHRKHLGYVEFTLRSDSVLGARGDRFRGHEYHYSELLRDPTAVRGWRDVYQTRPPRGSTFESGGFQRGNILASYIHAHFASRPQAAMKFADLCEARNEQRHADQTFHRHPARQPGERG